MHSGAERLAVIVLSVGLLGGCTAFPPLAGDDPDYRRELALSAWRVESFWGQPMKGAPAPTISFGEATVKVFSGCNSFTARYAMKGRLIHITDIERESDHSCNPDMTTQEARLLNALDLVRKGDLGPANTLSLRMKHGVPIQLQRQQ